MGSLGNNTQTQTTQSGVMQITPTAYPQAEPYLNEIMAGSQALYNANLNMQPQLQGAYDRFYDFSGQTAPAAQAPFNAASAGASQPMQVFGTSPQQYMDVIGHITSGRDQITTGPQWSQLYGQALSQNAMPNSILGGIAQTGGNWGNLDDLWGVGYNKALTQGTGGSAADYYLGNVAGASGSDNPFTSAQPGQNPFLQDLLNANAERIGNRVSSAMSGSGRYGSFGHADALARTINETNLPILNQAYEADQNRRLSAYENEMARKLGATGQMDASRNAAMQNYLSAISGRTNLFQTQNANRMAAAQAEAASRRGDLGAAESAIAGLGGVQGQNIANRLNASNAALAQQNQAINQQQQWAQLAPSTYNLAQDPYSTQFGLGQYSQNYPWQNLGLYQQGITGISPLVKGSFTAGGPSTTETSVPTPWTSIAGLGLGALSLFGKGGPFATGGALAGFLSDRNAKTDIEYLGIDSDTGLKLYAYRYKADPKHYPKVVGPMAQEVQQLYPDAVKSIGGNLVIDYSKVA